MVANNLAAGGNSTPAAAQRRLASEGHTDHRTHRPTAPRRLENPFCATDRPLCY